jgi:hypothetical protein
MSLEPYPLISNEEASTNEYILSGVNLKENLRTRFVQYRHSLDLAARLSCKKIKNDLKLE